MTTAPRSESECQTILKERGIGPACRASICPEAMRNPTVHRLCAEVPPTTPIAVVVCANAATGEQVWNEDIIATCEGLHEKDPNWALMSCFCCCGLDGAPAAADPARVVPGAVAAGGTIWRAALRSADGRPVLIWSPGRIAFADALSGADPADTVLVVTDRPDGGPVPVSPDQPMVLADGRLAQAATLRPGDRLLSASGAPVTVTAVGRGRDRIGHLALDAGGGAGPLDRLFGRGGLMVADYDTQIGFADLPPDAVSAAHAARPPLAEAEGPGRTVQMVGTGPDPARFDLIADAAGEASGTAKMLRDAQADDVARNGTLVPPDNPAVRDKVDRALALMRGYYPKVTFDYNARDTTPNITARYDFWGTLVVTLNGGFAGQTTVGVEGLEMALSHCIAAFDADGHTPGCVGVADYNAFGVIGRRIWAPASYVTNVLAALDQWTALFALVDPAHAGGDPADPCGDPALSCRIESAQAGFTSARIPACAQPTAPPLVLSRVWVLQSHLLALGFDRAVAPGPAGDVGNYALDPAVPIQSAGVDARDPETVLLTLAAAVEPGATYRLTVRALTSAAGGALRPDPTEVPFTVPG